MNNLTESTKLEAKEIVLELSKEVSQFIYSSFSKDKVNFLNQFENVHYNLQNLKIAWIYRFQANTITH
jgi:hypothetical protein